MANSSGNREATGLAPANPRRRATSGTVGMGFSSNAFNAFCTPVRWNVQNPHLRPTDTSTPRLGQHDTFVSKGLAGDGRPNDLSVRGQMTIQVTTGGARTGRRKSPEAVPRQRVERETERIDAGCHAKEWEDASIPARLYAAWS